MGLVVMACVYKQVCDTDLWEMADDSCPGQTTHLCCASDCSHTSDGRLDATKSASEDLERF